MGKGAFLIQTRKLVDAQSEVVESTGLRGQKVEITVLTKGKEMESGTQTGQRVTHPSHI